MIYYCLYNFSIKTYEGPPRASGNIVCSERILAPLCNCIALKELFLHTIYLLHILKKYIKY